MVCQWLISKQVSATRRFIEHSKRCLLSTFQGMSWTLLSMVQAQWPPTQTHTWTHLYLKSHTIVRFHLHNLHRLKIYHLFLLLDKHDIKFPGDTGLEDMKTMFWTTTKLKINSDQATTLFYQGQTVLIMKGQNISQNIPRILAFDLINLRGNSDMQLETPE